MRTRPIYVPVGRNAWNPCLLSIMTYFYWKKEFIMKSTPNLLNAIIVKIVSHEKKVNRIINYLQLLYILFLCKERERERERIEEGAQCTFSDFLNLSF